MLKELSIRNFAIIDDLTVDFSDGLTVLTGETGRENRLLLMPFISLLVDELLQNLFDMVPQKQN